MAFDRESVAIVIGQPLRLLVERRARLIGQLGRVGFEENAVTDIDDKVLLAAGDRGAAPARALVSVCLAQPAIASVAKTAAANLALRKMVAMFIRVPSISSAVSGDGLPDRSSYAGLAAPSLSEGSVNLDGRLQTTPDPADFPESFCNG
jgi:hypothetical protein